MMPDNASGTQPTNELPQHRTEPITDVNELPAPSFQPGSLPNEGAKRFSTTEILWWNNGIWGEAGYAIPNDGGKPVTKNSIIWGLHRFLGRELFKLLHTPDVKFSRPPNGEWVHNLAKMIRLGRKRMADRSVGWNDDRDGDTKHNTSNVKAFVVYPIPFFGDRVRNPDAKEWSEIILILLGEMMQHSDNDLDGNITDLFGALVDEQLGRIEYLLATKFLGATRVQARSSDFLLPTVIDSSNYNPDSLFTESEMIDERPPVNWWPTSNDLSPINGIPMPTAKAYAMRWPIAGVDFYGDQGSHERAFPGGSTGSGRILRPGSRSAEL